MTGESLNLHLLALGLLATHIILEREIERQRLSNPGYEFIGSQANFICLLW